MHAVSRRSTGLIGVVAAAGLVSTGLAAVPATAATDPAISINNPAVAGQPKAGTVVLSGHFVEIPEDDDDLERKAELKGAAGATGQAEVEVSKTNNQLDQEVEVSVTKLTPGATYAVFVDGKQLGTFQTDKNGKGELELNTPPVKKS